ncbi:MAG: hypothetical protein R3218_00425 [Christiangramia sp.]|nr:hypothetical protein [Christiangramia sp.]
MKKYVFIIPILFLQTSFCQTTQSFDLEKIYSNVLQGEMTKVLSLLDSVPDEAMTYQEKNLKQKFYRRFKYKDEIENYKVQDTMLKNLLRIYRKYWQEVLCDKDNILRYDNDLKKEVVDFLTRNGFSREVGAEKRFSNSTDLENKFEEHLKDFLNQNGYYSATGKTALFYDLLVWKTEVPVKYEVVLPESEVLTEVVFLEDIISLGWQEYSTFERYYPGGWATEELIYAVGKAYDTTSEKFKISYLKHEAQHFADYKNYPLLSGADLEYRAKLTELIYAQETFYDLINSFVKNASSEGRIPHPFANHILIRNLSNRIFGKEFISDIELWKTIPKEKIRKESRNLLLENSKRLQRKGGNTAVNFIN